MQDWIEGLGVWVLACVSITPKRNKTQDKRIDTEIQSIAYPEGSHSFLGVKIWHSPFRDSDICR